jgi:hypothetical protein
MNIRIKELAEQAWDSLIDEMGDVVSEDGRLNWDFLHAYDQRFAELIVKECCLALQPMLRDMISRGQGVDMIVRHFGVEE